MVKTQKYTDLDAAYGRIVAERSSEVKKVDLWSWGFVRVN
jgi:hypothetical protein